MALPPNLRELISPLALASYLAWAAVWFSNSHWLGSSPGGGWLADVLMVGFIVQWLVFLQREERTSAWTADLQLVVLSVCALGLIALGRSGSSPILLILVVSQFAARLPWAPAVATLVSINLVYLILMLTTWGLSWRDALLSLCAYGAFQLFAVLVLRYADQAERMANELRLVNADLMATRSLLAESARDQERLRLSRELHDVAGHKLTALRMNLRALRSRPELSDVRELVVSDELAAQLLDDLRAVVRQLRRGDGLSLEAGLRQLAAPLASFGLDVTVEQAACVERIEQAETLLRIAQEGLTNAVRHGRADHAWLSLCNEHGRLILKLDDDGRVNWPLREGVGIKGMRERLADLEGELKLSPSTRGGLQVRVELPVAAVQ